MYSKDAPEKQRNKRYIDIDDIHIDKDRDRDKETYYKKWLSRW